MKQLLFIISILLCILSCKTKTATITEKRSHVATLHDTLIIHDTLQVSHVEATHDTTTVTTLIQQLDSARLAQQYHIIIPTGQAAAYLIDRQTNTAHTNIQNDTQHHTTNTYSSVRDTLRDTLYINKLQTITKEVHALYWYEKFFIYIGIFTLLLLVCYLARQSYTKYKSLL